MRRFAFLPLAIAVLAVLVGCAGRTTGATNIRNISATLNATVRCDSGEKCKWYWEYWRVNQPRSQSVKTSIGGPVDGPTGDVGLSANISGLTPRTEYYYVLCGSPNNGGAYGCVGDDGKVGSTTADPPPDYGFFETLSSVTLAERWNGTSWTIQATPNSGRGAELRGVSCTSATACTAVGTYDDASRHAKTLAERWNGSSWAVQTTPNSPGSFEFNFLSGVSCASATACIAAGFHYTSGSDGGSTLAEHWNGTSWAIRTTPNRGGHSDLKGVSCTSPTACTAVGLFHMEAPVFFRTLAERWNGTSWTIQTTAADPSGSQGSDLSGVSCTSGTTCTAVGWYRDGAGVDRTLAERWNGTSWTLQTTPNPAGATSSYLYDVSCTSATACIAVGSWEDANGVSRTLAQRWNGTSWAIQTTPNPGAGGSLRGVSCTSATACTAVGSYRTAGGSQLTLALRWNGTSWSVQATPNPPGDPSASLSDVSCTSATACTAVGSN